MKTLSMIRSGGCYVVFKACTGNLFCDRSFVLWCVNGLLQQARLRTCDSTSIVVGLLFGELRL